MPYALPASQPTASKHWRQITIAITIIIIDAAHIVCKLWSRVYVTVGCPSVSPINRNPPIAEAWMCAADIDWQSTLHIGCHSLCMAPWSGTPCRTTSALSRTRSPIDRAWKPGFSPDTSVFGALVTFVIIALYKSTFTIPYHTIPYHTIPYHTVPYQSITAGTWAVAAGSVM